MTASQEALNAQQQLGARLANASIGPRLAQFMEGLNRLTALSNASPSAITQQLEPQFAQARDALKKMFEQSSLRLGGPLAGGQLVREQAKTSGAIMRPMTQATAQLPERARNALISLIENFQMTPQAATPITQIGTSPFNAAGLFGSLQSGAELGKVGKRVDQWLESRKTSQGGAYPGSLEYAPQPYWEG